MTVETYQQALDWLYGFVRFDKERRTPGTGDLNRMRGFLTELGNPQSRFPSILIAGTKGKGSTAAMLARILEAAGYRTGLFSSPHLHTFLERVQVNRILITRGELVDGVRRLEALANDFPDVIWFELVTALAFCFFAERDIDIAVLEVGLGGRLDPTNVVQPLVSAITPISIDHTDVLGTTLRSIALEKAGIIKDNTPVVSSPQPEEAFEVIERIANSRGSKLSLVGRDWTWDDAHASVSGQSFRVRGPRLAPTEFSIPLLGRHQRVNATTAIGVAAQMAEQSWAVPIHAVRSGLAAVQWPARLELLGKSPVILVDGAHNRASAHELRVALDDLLPGCRLHLVFGASSDKDIGGMLDELLPRAASLILTHSRHIRAASVELLQNLAKPYATELAAAPDVPTALMLARNRASSSDVICVTGSLFVASEARAILLAEKGIIVETDDS